MKWGFHASVFKCLIQSPFDRYESRKSGSKPYSKTVRGGFLIKEYLIIVTSLLVLPKPPCSPLSGANLELIAWNFLIHSGTKRRRLAFSYLGERLLKYSTELRNPSTHEL